MTLTAAGPAHASRGVRVEVDRRASHPEWDAWVAATPGGHHLQTSSWARVQASAGWRAARVILSSGSGVAGCQLLVRDLPPVGSVALSPRGPLLSPQTPELLDQILAAVERVARDEGIVHAKLQPPVDRDDLAAQLRLRGLKPSDPQPPPVAGVRVDLSRYSDEDRMFEALPPATRERVRRAQSSGLTVWTGGERELPVLQKLLDAAAERQDGLAPQPPDYPRCLWEAFAPSHATLQLAEHDGRPLAASLLIAFGDTVLYEIGAPPGARGCPPGTDELMHWTAIRRAYADGFRYYDFGRTPLEVARAVLAGAEPSSDTGHASFESGLGFEVVSVPCTYDLALGRVVGPLLSRATPSHRLPSVLHGGADGHARPPVMESAIWRWYDAVLTPRVLRLRRRAIRTLDRSMQIRTAGIVAPGEPPASSGHSLGYEPSPWTSLYRILRRGDVTSDDVFVDFGSGMGRVLYQAALRYPFRRVEGVELKADLTAVAQENLDRGRHRFRCQDIRLVTCDVVAYEIPDDLTIAYFFNPFQGPIFRSVVERLLESVERHPRRLRLIYVNPVEERLVLGAGFREVRRLRGVQPGQWHARMYELTGVRSRPASDSLPPVTRTSAHR